MARLRTWSSVGIVFASICASAACSAPAGGDGDDAVPDYVGAVPGSSVNPTSNVTPGNVTPGNPPPGNVTAPGTGVTPVGSAGPATNEGSNPGAVPLSPNTGANGTGGGAPPAGAGGAGGASMLSPTDPGTPASGAGGSAMPSAAGAGNTPVDPVPQNPPPAPQPPVPPPPVVTPPPVNPGPVGGGCSDAAFFCEDFESFAVGTAQANERWRPEGNVSIDGATVQGTRSLHVQANPGQASRIFVEGFAPPNNSFFGRMNVFVQAFPTSPNFAHYVLVEVTGNGGEQVRPIGGQLIQDNNVGNVWGVGSDRGATGDWTAWRATAPAVGGQWLCMEWRMDDANNAIDIFIDEQAKPELSVSTNSHDGNGAFQFPDFNSIWFGWTVFQGGSAPAPFNVFIDDIVLSTERVGCP